MGIQLPFRLVSMLAGLGDMSGEVFTGMFSGSGWKASVQRQKKQQTNLVKHLVKILAKNLVNMLAEHLV